MTAIERDLPLRLLDWYRAMGVDAAIGDEAIDWFHRADKPGAGFTLLSPAGRVANAPVGGNAKPLQPAPMPARPNDPPTRPAANAERRPLTPSLAAPPSRAFVATSPDAAVTAAKVAATKARSIEELGRELTTFDGCALKATAKHLVFFRGAPQARLMIVGEAPGREEDLAGAPFVGPAGQLLDRMLAAIGLTGEQCHFTPVVYWRPPGNRTPTLQETDVCRPFLERQISLVTPDVVLLLGASAASQLIDIGDGIMRARGKWHDLTFHGHRIKAIASHQPSHLLRVPSSKNLVWRDLLAVKAALAT